MEKSFQVFDPWELLWLAILYKLVFSVHQPLLYKLLVEAKNHRYSQVGHGGHTGGGHTFQEENVKLSLAMED